MLMFRFLVSVKAEAMGADSCSGFSKIVHDRRMAIGHQAPSAINLFISLHLVAQN